MDWASLLSRCYRSKVTSVISMTIQGYTCHGMTSFPLRGSKGGSLDKGEEEAPFRLPNWWQKLLTCRAILNSASKKAFARTRHRQREDKREGREGSGNGGQNREQGRQGERQEEAHLSFFSRWPSAVLDEYFFHCSVPPLFIPATSN